MSNWNLRKVSITVPDGPIKDKVHVFTVTTKVAQQLKEWDDSPEQDLVITFTDTEGVSHTFNNDDVEFLEIEAAD